MFYYRVTKYNPKYRNEKGHYLKDEWTDYGDVGTQIAGHTLSMVEYEQVENLYIQVVLLFMKQERISWLECLYIEKWTDDIMSQHIPDGWKTLYNRIHMGSRVQIKEVPILLKLMLRNYLFCKLEHTDKMFVHFGYDYYMYVGVQTECNNTVNEIFKSGLYVEDFVSPYLDDEDDI
jgi:hypothetical protein